MSLKIDKVQLEIIMKADSARAEMLKLDDEAKRIQKSMKGLKKDSEEYIRKNEELTKVKLKMQELRNQIGITGMSMRELQQRSKELQLQLRNIDPRTDKFKEYRKELDAVNGRMKELRGGADKTQFSLMSITKTNFSKLVGPYLGITALISFFRTLTSTILDFSKATSELKALTGATGKDLDFLKRSAKELGAQYGKSATDIVTAMKLVGSAKPELLQNVEALSMMTESAIILSKATGMSMEDTTNNLTTIMNQFGLSAAEGDRVINTLAAGSKFGAKEVDYLGDSISKVGVTMKSAGLSLETGVAIMELFGEKGVRAETAGNGFKRVLVELQKDTANYTNGVFDLNKAIDNNQNIAGDNIALQKKFGTEFFGLAQILFQNKERFKELNQQVTGTTTAMEQYLDATDNLSGDIDKMTASWKTFILSMEDGQGPIANTFRTLISWVTKGIDALTSLTKSGGQKEQDLIVSNTNQRIESFKKTLNEIEGVDKKIKEINASIIAERGVYKKYDERIAFLKEEIRWRKNLGGAWDDNNKKMQKEIDSLAKLRNRSVSYVNALGGLRSTLNPATVVDDDTTTTTNTTTKSKEDIANERERKALAAIDAWKKKEELLIKEKYSLGQLSKEKYIKDKYG
ncbi:MAG: phage tail tape measure protein, partial [Clostridia bacterium]|nr:phage tail tape measure protein [Clostridia bacterium]